MKLKPVVYIFFGLLCLSLLTPLVVSSSVLFPFVFSKAVFFRVIIDLALPFYIYLVFSRKEYQPSLKNPLTWAVLGFLAANILSSFFGVSFLRSMWGNIERMGGTWNLLHFVLLYFYIQMLAVVSPKRTQQFLKVFLWIAIVSVLYGVWVYLKLPGFFADPYLPERVSSTFGNPIFFASFLVLPLFLAVFFILQEEARSWKVVYGVAAFLLLVGIYQSATRGAFVGLVIGALFGSILYIFRPGKVGKRTKEAGIVSGVAVLVLLLFLLGRGSSQNSFLFRLTHLSDNNSTARIIQWKTALTGYKDAPVFGVGPENYYALSNKYYNPETYNYDTSWFDKPHNYLLEILVTTGAVGFLTYLGILISLVWIFWNSFKCNLLSWFEFCVLLAGMLAYQIQNLFVFDTVSASLTFFVYLGFGAFLWNETKQITNPDVSNKFKQLNFSNIALNFVFAVSAVVIFYVIYLTNTTSWAVAKNLNSAVLLSKSSPEQALGYFETAKQEPFVFDPGEIALKYADFASGLYQSQTGNLTAKVIDNALDSLHHTNILITNYPIYWYRLSELYMAKASLNNSVLSPEAEVDAQKAVALAPTRLEPLSVLAQVYSFEGQADKSEEIIKRMVVLYPKAPDAFWQYAKFFHAIGKDPEAAVQAGLAIDKGYVAHNPENIAWLIEYYINNSKFQEVIRAYSSQIKVDPRNTQWYASLAATYVKVGEKDKAIEIAKQIIAIDPSQQDQVNQFIQSLK